MLQISLVALSGDLPPLGVALVIAFLVLSLGIHEASHAWVALKCGDPTARDMGRITLNPIAHIDIMWTIVMPTVLFLAAGIPFGGAKPVPVQFHNLRHPYRDMALVAAAGPFSNFLLALVFFAVFKVVVQKIQLWPEEAVGSQVLFWAIYLNLILAVFNMIPIPPLDGSRIMTWLLPQKLREPYARLEVFGMMLVLIVVFSGMLTTQIRATIEFMYDLVRTIVSLGGLW